MKKYRYKKSAFIAEFVVTSVFVAGLLVLLFFIEKNLVMKCSIFSVALIIIVFNKQKDIMLKRCVTLEKTSIMFSSFWLSHESTGSYKTDLSNITHIYSSWLPFIGVFGVKIRTTEYVNPFTVNFCFENHKDFYFELCKAVKKKNENVYIDKRLQKFIKEKEEMK